MQIRKLITLRPGFLLPRTLTCHHRKAESGHVAPHSPLQLLCCCGVTFQPHSGYPCFFFLRAAWVPRAGARRANGPQEAALLAVRRLGTAREEQSPLCLPAGLVPPCPPDALGWHRPPALSLTPTSTPSGKAGLHLHSLSPAGHPHHLRGPTLV